MKAKAKGNCAGCGQPWSKHLGVQGTCTALQVAMTTLKQIAGMKRNTPGRQLAFATVVFIDSQVKKQ